MALLFGEYDLLMRSGLFDPEFYRSRYPDVAALNLDPLTHYLERGCHERRDPGAEFDTLYYLEQCLALGMTPGNPLLHYLTVGAKQGLLPNSAASIELHIDVPRIAGDSVLEMGGKGLSIVGWAHAASGIQSVDIRVDDRHVIFARLGLARPDVPKAFKHLAQAGHCGFATYVPAGAIGQGMRNVSVEARTAQGKTRSMQFRIDAGVAAADPTSSSLRTRVDAATTGRCLAALDRRGPRPSIGLIMALPLTSADRHTFQRTLESLSSQVYDEWKVRLVPPAPKTAKAVSLAKLLGSFSDLVNHFNVLSDQETFDLVMPLRVGDRLAADALLEFALAAAKDSKSELFYADDLRPDPATGDLAVFHKPGWSPDLLAASNYLGRAWCVRWPILERAGLTLGDFARLDAHEAALRLTKESASVRHLPSVLHEAAAAIAAVGKQDGPRTDARVSVIIPLDSADDSIRSCLARLRRHTRYRNLEIICAVSAPVSRETRRWLDEQVDQVIVVREAYQWARFCNRGAKKASGKYLLFLDAAVEARSERWLAAMLRYIARPGRGVVGPILESQDGSISDAGCTPEPDGTLGRLFQGQPATDPGYFGLTTLPRNVSAVSHSVVLTSTDTFRGAGGFSEDLPADLSAADYCLKLRQEGLHHVIAPEARVLLRGATDTAVTEEEASRFRGRWAKVIDRGDPYVNPNLARDGQTPGLEPEPVELVHSGAPQFSSSAVRRILIVKLDHIGDCVTALPAVRRLKKHFPDAELTVLCASGTVPLWRAEPAVAAIVEFNLFKARSGDGKHEVTEQDQRRLAGQLKAQEFDLAVDLRKQPDSRHILEECGAAIRAGFDHAGRFPWLDIALEWDEDVPLRPKHGHVSWDLVALVDRIAHAGAPGVQEQWPAMAPLSLPRNLLRQLSAKTLICVHPAAGSPMRQWPAERFGGLIELLLEQQYGVALIGGPDDAALIAEVLRMTPSAKSVINLAGRLTLAELPALLGTAVLFIGNNSGPQHIAAAVGVPTLGIHSGVVDATEWGPRGANAVAIRRRMSCSPCFLNTPSECQRGLACLTGLTVADVLRACATLLPARVDGSV